MEINVTKERNLCPVKISRHAPQLFHTDCTYPERFLHPTMYFVFYTSGGGKKSPKKKEKAFGVFCKTPGTQHAISYLSDGITGDKSKTFTDAVNQTLTQRYEEAPNLVCEYFLNSHN